MMLLMLCFFSIWRRLATIVLSGLLIGCIWLLRLTWRLRVIGELPPRRSLIAFWHGDQLALCRVSLRRSVSVLVSRSRDGQLAAWVARSLGLGVIRGSSSKGAVAGALGVIRRLLGGETVAIAVDGPRGPHHQTGSTSLRMARRGGAVIIPAAATARRGVSLRSWDRMFVPAPFSKVYVVFGSPVEDALQEELLATWNQAAVLAMEGS